MTLSSSPHIVIAGAGILGASLAYHLAKRGARVTILEARHPAAAASGNSFGWLNATFSKRPRSYFDFSMLGIAGWHRLEQELDGALQIQWGGSVAWFPPGPEAEQLRRDILQHRPWGYKVRVLDESELLRLVPQVAPGEIAIACHCEQEGALDPIHAVNLLLEKAKHFGAEIRCPCELTGFDLASGRIRLLRTSQGPIEADALVLACGVDSPRLARLAGVLLPLKDAPGILVHTKPQPPLLESIIQAPGVHGKQDSDGRIVAGGQVVAGAGTAEAPLVDAHQVLAQAARYVPALATVSAEQVTLGYRVMPRDEYPILGFAEACTNLYLAATHSGITLAPVIGELGAREILDGARLPELMAYRTERFS